MNRVPQKSAKWGTQWIRKKEYNKLLSPKARSMFDLLQSVLAPILPHQQDALIATLTNEILLRMDDAMADMAEVPFGEPVIFFKK